MEGRRDPEDHKPTDASFYDDSATADLSAKVSEAWADFDRALAEALRTLPPGATLDLTLDPTAAGTGGAVYTVSVSPVDGGQLRAFAIGNASLPPEHRLSLKAVGELVAMGWSPPGVVDASDQRFGLSLPVSEAPRVAAIVTRTLRDVYGTPHPAFLVYDTEPADAAIPSLGAARAVTGDGGPDLDDVDFGALPLPEQVNIVVAHMLNTTPDTLPADQDGDITIRSGSAMVFVRVRDDPPLVDVFSPVLTGVKANEQLYVRLSELNSRMIVGRLYCSGDTVWASVPVFGRQFQPTHLMIAIEVMTRLADELDDLLHGEFGGKRFFVESDHLGTDAPKDHPTGMYL